MCIHIRPSVVHVIMFCWQSAVWVVRLSHCCDETNVTRCTMAWQTTQPLLGWERSMLKDCCNHNNGFYLQPIPNIHLQLTRWHIFIHPTSIFSFFSQRSYLVLLACSQCQSKGNCSIRKACLFLVSGSACILLGAVIYDLKRGKGM